MKLLNRVMAWANEGVGWIEGEGGFLGCMGLSGQGWERSLKVCHFVR